MQKSSHQKFHGRGLTFGFCNIYFCAPSSVPCLSRQMKTFPGVLIHNDLRKYTILVQHSPLNWSGVSFKLWYLFKFARSTGSFFHLYTAILLTVY